MLEVIGINVWGIFILGCEIFGSFINLFFLKLGCKEFKLECNCCELVFVFCFGIFSFIDYLCFGLGLSFDLFENFFFDCENDVSEWGDGCGLDIWKECLID